MTLAISSRSFLWAARRCSTACTSASGMAWIVCGLTGAGAWLMGSSQESQQRNYAFMSCGATAAHLSVPAGGRSPLGEWEKARSAVLHQWLGGGSSLSRAVPPYLDDHTDRRLTPVPGESVPGGEGWSHDCPCISMSEAEGCARQN